jgi:3-hydroxybutyryl-CoA dehydratase
LATKAGGFSRAALTGLCPEGCNHQIALIACQKISSQYNNKYAYEKRCREGLTPDHAPMRVFGHMTQSPRLVGPGFYWQDFSAGDRYRTLARTITEADIIAFVGVTGMTEVLFTDQTFGQGVAARGRVSPAALTYTLIEGIQCQTLIQATGLALLEVDKKVLAPVTAGDTVHAILEVLEVRQTSKGNRAVVTTRNDIVNQNGETVITYTAKRLIAGR